MLMVLLSALVERFSVSRLRDFSLAFSTSDFTIMLSNINHVAIVAV